MPDLAAPVLAVTGLRKEFGSLVAVDDVNFAVQPGKSMAVVGESGSGKTTIARMIVGLERPTSGTISACGADRTRPARSGRDRRRRGREVQIVFQDPYTSLDPRQSAEDVIDETLRLHHDWPADRRRHRVAEPLTWSAWIPGKRAPGRRRYLAASGNGSRSPAPWRLSRAS